jgi:hypothetical protein
MTYFSVEIRPRKGVRQCMKVMAKRSRSAPARAQASGYPDPADRWRVTKKFIDGSIRACQAAILRHLIVFAMIIAS